MTLQPFDTTDENNGYVNGEPPLSASMILQTTYIKSWLVQWKQPKSLDTNFTLLASAIDGAFVYLRETERDVVVLYKGHYTEELSLC